MLLIIFLIVSCTQALSVITCDTCSKEDNLLHFDGISQHKKLTAKHTFLTQICIPDNVGFVTTIVYKFTYTLSPSTDVSWKAVYSPKIGKSELVRTERHIAVATWIDVLDGTFKKLGVARVQNRTHNSVRARGAECVEFRYFGSLPAHNNVQLLFDVEIWWMGYQTKK